MSRCYLLYIHKSLPKLGKSLLSQGANSENTNSPRKISRFVILESFLRKQNLAGLLAYDNVHDIAQLHT